MTQKFDAREGDPITYGPYEFTILEMIDYHIESIEVKRISEKTEKKPASVLFNQNGSFQSTTGQATVSNQ